MLAGLLLVVGLASAAYEVHHLDIKDNRHSNEIKAPSLTLDWNGESFDLAFRSDQGILLLKNHSYHE